MKEFQKLIIPEINNKLFIRKARKIKIINSVQQNLVLENLVNFALIKNIISIEIYTGQRPIILASSVKKNLIITLKVTKPGMGSLLPLVQKKPKMWKSTVSSLFDDYYYPPYVDKKMAISYNKINKINNWIKSAYLD